MALFLAAPHLNSPPAHAQAQTLTDRAILEALYDATDGPNWTNDTNWKIDPDLNEWHGVSTNGGGRVTELQLSTNGLTGEIPAELGSLTNLTNLDLRNNELTGEIPAELRGLTNLVLLHLDGNRLTGTIPSWLGSFTNLVQLTLTNNKLTGGIPSSLGSLTNLERLYLDGNDLTGDIPPQLGSLTKLDRLLLHENRLTGKIPPELGNLTDLKNLDLKNNELTGKIPDELGSLTKLTNLDLENNELTGEIPVELGRLTNLVSLALNGNELTGEIPAELGSLTKLVLLYLNGNDLTGDIPPQLGSLTKLERLELNENRLTGEIPDELGSLTTLTTLNLRNNELTGEIPDELGSLTDLNELYLNNNELTGEIPPELGDLTNLRLLYLDGNDLTGDIPPQLGSLTALWMLSLWGNDLTGAIPSVLGDLTNLRWLWLHQNRLTGEIPSSLNSLTNLRQLYLSGNELTGEIPDLSALTGLTHLYLSQNRLTGELPDLSGLTALIQLGLGGNNLNLSWAAFESDGMLPLESLTALTRLYLDDSGLVGAIPSWLGNLVGLEDLRLHGNNLDGGWAALKRVTALRALTMSLNAFSGNGLLVWFDGRPNFLSVPAGALPAGVDAIKSLVTWSAVTVDPAAVHVPPHPHIARVADPIEESAVDIAFLYRDGDDEPVDGALKLPAVVCLPVPSTHAGKELRLLRHDGSSWRYLETADVPSGYDPGTGMVAVCGTTSGFSRFVPAVVELASGASGAGRVGFIKRIEPSIRAVTLSSGDVVKLSFDIWGRQDILNNDLGDGHVFAWSGGGAGGRIETTDRANEIIYTTPEIPGKYTITATSPDGACLSGEDDDETVERCTAKFTITVRRPSAVPEERPAPKNPVGEIPSVLADAEGRQYEVFTPEGGGFFDGGDVTVSAEAGGVPNLEIIGVRAEATGSASNVGVTTQRYTLVGDRYDVLAVDTDGAAISSYVLDAPLEVCVPLPAEARHDISNIALVTDNADDTLTVLSASVRITASSGTNVCGTLGTLPATIAVGTAGSPDAIPTATPEVEPAIPDTGGAAPTGNWLLMLMILGTAVTLGSVALASRCRRARQGITAPKSHS
ncbi:MAG: leucine-rich repeat domain-containing protein [Chloroflexi bacterium]|nr:leucine-rich repeat domain-containing protein [Chloroflexota bacterium]